MSPPPSSPSSPTYVAYLLLFQVKGYPYDGKLKNVGSQCERFNYGFDVIKFSGRIKLIPIKCGNVVIMRELPSVNAVSPLTCDGIKFTKSISAVPAALLGEYLNYGKVDEKHIDRESVL